MESDDFFETIDQEVFVAKADKINVYVRYADTTQGSTTPNGSATFKVDVSGNVSCVTNTSYGFHHWAAFSTDNFNINGQNPNILYNSDNDEYIKGQGQFELPDSVVTFGNKYSESTSVIIHKNRSDIVLVPIVAARPSVDRTSPPNSARDVVRNTSIRCIFTKKMTLASFTKDTVKITSGFSVLTDVETPTTDITDRYIWGDPSKDESYSPMVSASGKLVTFRLKNGSENYIDSNQQITVTFSPELKDADGYEEGVKNEFYFITGTSIDALAPILQEVKGGINGKFKDFDSAEKANRDIIAAKPFEDVYFDPYLPQRVKDYVNVYIFAADIGGEGTGVSIADPDENAVIYYGTRARLLYDSNGEAVDSSAPENNIEIKQEAYVPNGNYVLNSTDTTGGLGCAFRYDLKALPDGIVEIDVWAVDSVGNSGLTEPHYNTYNNGYRALLVVKDTTPPVPNVTTISAQSASATYGWYNESTLGETNLKTSAAVTDSGNVRVRAAENTIKWAFTVGDNAAAWKPVDSDAAWRLVTVGDYALTGITAQNEGAVGILMSLMDDMGNISAPVPLGNAVMFDKTKPAISSLTWVNSSGAPVQGITSDESLTNYLKINFTEEMSGVREVILDVNSSTGINGTTKFFTEIGGAPISYTIGTRDGKTCAVLAKPADAEGYKTGSIFVQGINLGGGTEGKYTISSALCDAALNTSAVLSKQLGLDKTPPVLNKIVIPLIERIKRFGEDLWRYFIGKDTCISNSIKVQLYITEETSGIKVIDFSGGDIKPSASSTIKMTAGGVTKNITDFTVSGGVITFGENQLYEISNENEFILEISGCQFTHIKSASHTIEKNLISVKLTDFAGLNNTPLNKAIFASDNAEYTEIFANALPAATPTITLADRGTDASGTADLIPAQTGFTNYKVVNGTVIVPVASSTNDFVELKLANGAVFTNTTTIAAKEVGGSTISITGEYSISADKKSIKFTKAFSADKYAGGIELTIENIELPTGDGAKTVAMQTLASTALASSNGTANITLDTTAPLTRGACSYTTDAKYYPKTVDTVTPTYGKELTSGGIPYFYAKDTTRQFDIINKETSGTYYKVDDNEYSIKISTTKTTAADIYNDSGALTEFKPTSPKVTIEMEAQDPTTARPYSYILYDVAGNYSEVKQFYLIKDEVAQAVADNKITPQGSATAHFFKNAANATDHTRTYVMKQATDEYKIVVNLSDYAEKLTNATHSGLAQWAITSDGANPTSWQNYDSTQNSGNIEYFINSVTEGKKLTLFLKDNCGNTTNIDVKDDDGYTNTILWKIDNVAPSVDAFYPLSTMTSLTVGTANASTDVYGSSFFKNDPQTTYYNDGAALGVKYNAESCLYTTANATETATDDYTVKARLYFTEDTSEVVNATTFPTTSPRLSPWYYFADVSGGRTFFVPYPTRPEGTPQGKLYLLLEDKVGNQSVTQVTYKDSKTIDKFVYISHPPRIVSGGADYSESDIPLAAGDYYVSGSTIYVNGSEGKIPNFNIDLVEYAPIRERITGSGFDIYYLYSNDGTLNWSTAEPTVASVGTKIASSENLSAAFDKKVPVDSLDEAGTSATPKKLYLYVRDVVGNNQKKRLGNGKKYLKDSEAPTVNSWSSGTDHTTPSNSYIKQEDASGTMSITIAASTQEFKDAKRDSEPYTVYIPKAWFSDNGGSGVYGIGFDKDNASTASTTIATSNGVECFALKVPASKYNATGTYDYYVYDKVYNCKKYSLSIDADDRAPTVGVKFSVTAADARLHSDDLYKSYAGTPLAQNPLDTTDGYAGTNSAAYTLETHEVQAEKTLWTNTAATGAVTLEVSATDTNGISLITVNGTAYSAPVSVPLTATATKTLYEVAVTDRAGNTMTHKVNLQLDNTVPTFTSATVTPNTGARTKNTGANTTLYYNSITLNAEISDNTGGVELGAYRFGSENFATTTGTISKTYTDGTAIADEKITLTAHDKLGNKKENTTWTVAGTSPAVSATKFVFDNTAPAISSVVGKRDNVAAAAGSMFTVSNTGSTWAFTTTSAADCSIEITPTWTDSSDIYKYLVKTSNDKPSVADFNSGNAPGTSVTYTASPDAGKDIKFGTAFTRYLFAIDYAGNISEATTITVAYSDVAPKFTSATFGNIHSGTPNVYSPTIGYMTLTYETQSGGALTGYAFYSDASGATPIGSEQTVASATSPINIFLPEYANETATFDIYIRLKCATGESALTRLDGTWKMDKTKPAAPTVSGVQNSAGESLEGNGYHYDSATGKLYYKTATEPYLKFTLTGDATKLVTNSTYTDFTRVDTIDNPAPIKTLIADGGSTTFYAVDNALNPSETGVTVNYVQDTAAPTISSVTVATVEIPASGSYLNPDGTSDTYDFNAAKTGSSYNVRQIKFTVTASDNTGGSEIASYKYEWQGKTAVEKKVSAGSANEYTLTLDKSNSDYTAARTMSITAKDNVGNESLVKVITFNPDSTAPKIEVATFENGSDDIPNNSPDIYPENTDWKTVSGGTVCFNRNNISPAVTFKTDDVDATLTTPGSIDASGDATSTVTVTATDKVGNKSEFTVTFIADGTAPTFTHTGFYKNDAKASLETEYISPAIVAGVTTYYYNSNGSRKALPVFTANDDGANLKGVYIRSGSTDTVLSKNDSSYYYAGSVINTALTFVAIDKVGNEKTITFTIKQDATAPTIAGPKLATGASGVYLNDAKDKLYYKGDNSSRVGTLSFETISDTGGSELKLENGFFYSATETTTVPATLMTSLDTKDISTAGTYYFYTADNVSNISEKCELQFVNDTSAPTATLTAPTGSGGGYLISGDDFYFTTTAGVFTGNASFTISDATDGANGSDIKEYYYQIEGGSKVTFLATATTIDVAAPTAADDTKKISFYAVDNVGNEGKLAEYNLKLANSTPAPTVSAVQNSSGTTVTANIYGATGWKNTNNSTLFYKSSAYTGGIKLLFTSTEVANKFDGIYLDADNSLLTSNLSAAITTSTTLSVYAKDKLGNKSGNFEITVTPDEDAPAVPSVASITPQTGKKIYPTSGWTDGSEVYFGGTSVDVVFAPTDDVSGGSGFDGIYKDWNPTAHTTKLDGNKTTVTGDSTLLTVVSVDNVVNVSDSFSITLKKDSDVPEVSDINVTGDVDGGYDWDSTNKKFCFNANASSSKKIGKITITLTATDASGIDSVKAGSAESDKFKAGASNTYTLEITTVPTTETTLSIVATDNVGNPSTAVSVMLIPDATPPTLKVDSFKNNTADIDAGYIYSAASDWETVSGKTVFFNSDKIASPAVTFTVTETGSGILQSGGEDYALSYSAGTSISTADGASTTVTATATDKVGNSSTFAVTFTADKTGPGVPTVDSIIGTVGTPPDALSAGSYYPADYADWKESALCYFKGSSGTVKFTTPTDDGSGFDGIFEYNTSTNAIVGSAITTGIPVSEEKTITVVARDNVGNKSTVLTFKVKPDNAAPTATPTLSGTWHALSDSTGATKMSVYVSGAELAVTGSDDSGIASYVLQYGTAASTPAAADWTTPFAASITLPTITTAQDSYFWLWLKDNVGNATSEATQIKYSGSPIGMYTAPTGMSYAYDGTANAQKITISGYPISAGLQSIILEADEFVAGTEPNCAGVTVSKSFADGKITLTVVDNDSNAITIMQTSDIEIGLSLASITGLKVSVVDAAGTTTELAAPGGASMASRARAAVVGAADAVATGVKKIGTGVANSVKSLFGISSKPTTVEKPATVVNNTVPESASEITTAQNIAEIATTSVVETSAVEQNAPVSESASDSVTVPNIKKESVVRTLTYSTEEELSPTASISASASASASATDSASASESTSESAIHFSLLLLTAILASVVAFSAIFLLKKNKDVL